MSLSCSVSEIGRYWSKVSDWNLPHLYLAPLLGVNWLEFRRDFCHQKTQVPGQSYDIIGVMLGLTTLVQLRLVTDGRTDRHTMTANEHLYSPLLADNQETNK